MAKFRVDNARMMMKVPPADVLLVVVVLGGDLNALNGEA